jgi:hypothetical protein
VSLPSEFGGTGGQAGGGAEPQASELDGGVPDASTGDAGQADAGDGQLLGCSTADRANCDALVAALVHRYSFEGTGTTVADSVGSAAGSIVNGQLAGTGALALSGSDDFVDLPNGIVSQLSSGTFEVWLNWAGGERWQRAFDMGSSDAAEGTPGVGVDYLFLTPRALDDTVRVTFLSSETNGEVQINTSAPLASGSEQHLAVVVDAQGASLALYVDGALAGSAPLSSSLAAIHDVNNWLGRSQFTSDAPFEGSLLEFRIYGAALSAEQIALSFDLGPDAPVSP